MGALAYEQHAAMCHPSLRLVCTKRVSGHLALSGIIKAKQFHVSQTGCLASLDGEVFQHISGLVPVSQKVNST